MVDAEEQPVEWTLTGLPLPLVLCPASPMTDDQLIAFSRRNKPYRIERNTQGELTVMTPLGRDGGRRELRIASALMLWADDDGRGEANGPNAGWNLPDGSTLSPDASWTDSRHIAGFTREQTERYLPICPDFVIEVRSNSDSKKMLPAKMETWLSNGAKLAWMIDPYEATVTIYRPDCNLEVLERPEFVEGEAPIAGFRLTMLDLWASSSY